MVERSRNWIRQAAEKTLKAVFQKLGAEAFGHSVFWLISKLPNKFKPKEDLKNKAMELDKAYIPTRYPNAIPQGSPLRSLPEIARKPTFFRRGMGY